MAHDIASELAWGRDGVVFEVVEGLHVWPIKQHAAFRACDTIGDARVDLVDDLCVPCHAGFDPEDVELVLPVVGDLVEGAEELRHGDHLSSSVIVPADALPA